MKRDGYMIGYIYKTTNLINQKIYIGKHESPEYDHTYFGSGKILIRAINKYGIENFINEIIDTADTLQELNEKEKYYIKYYKENFNDQCYNIASGGDGGNTLAYKTPEEMQMFIDKMTAINRERCSTDEFKNKIRNATIKRYSNEEVRSEHSKKI